MGKYENVLKCIQIHRLVNENKYQKALETVQSLNMDKISGISDLKVIADVYMKTDQYEKAKNVYYMIYDKVKTHRVLYRLIILAIRSGNIEEAEELFQEYEGNDQIGSDRLILKYRLQKAKGEHRGILIQTLEELKEIDYMEEWAYELAKLYHKEGMKDQCLRECKDIVLWFGEGEIVKKAKVLIRHYNGELDLTTTQDLHETLKEQVSSMIVETDGKDKDEDVLGHDQRVDGGETKRIVIQHTKKDEVKEPELELKLSDTQKISDKLKLSDALELNRILNEMEKKKEFEKEADVPDIEETESVLGREPDQPKEDDELEETNLNTETKPEEDVIQKEDVSLETDGKQEAEIATEAAIEPESAVEPEEVDEPTEESESEVEPVSKEVTPSGYRRKFLVVEEFFVSVVNSSKDVQIVIVGEEDKFILAIVKKITKRLKECGYLSEGKIARIHAAKLNDIELMAEAEKLVGGCMLVEGASKLDASAIERLKRFMDEYSGRTVVVLTDLPDNMNVMLQKEKELDDRITHFLEV